jgi:predicted Zn-dependent peptidase
MAHPYRWPVLGWDSDISALTRDDMLNYYRTHYVPGNMVLVVVGDVKASEVFGWAEQYFGPIEAGTLPPPVDTVEPEQEAERRFVFHREVPLPMVRIAWHVPGVGDKDFFPLVCLEAVLSAGRSSRLQTRLVRGEAIASDASVWASTRIDDCLFVASGTAAPGTGVQELEDALLAEINDIINNGITEEELKKVKKQLRAGEFLDLESNQAKARVLGSWECRSSWKDAMKYQETVQLVTVEQVRAVAEKYLDHRRTVGWLLPEETK